jgi:ribokinase
LSNINFSRSFLRRARPAGVLIATDVHTISNLDDDYNRDFMGGADVLFMSDENLPCTPVEWVHRVQNRYPAEIIVVGLGSRGAVLAVRQDRFVERIPAVYTRPVVNSIGAGDALFSCFVHFYHLSREPYESMKKAMVYASYKIGESGAADGLLDEAGVNQLYAEKKNLFK